MRESAATGVDPSRPIECLYQPIVDLDTRVTVGYEALARWPSAPDLAPDVVFDAARRLGRLDELDRAAQEAAVRGAHRADLPTTHSLFINVEVDTSAQSSLVETLVGLAVDLGVRRVVIELTERALLVDPARVIAITDCARARGLAVALDDVGSNPDSLAMLEFVVPDIIKLDGRLIRSRRLRAAHVATIDTLTAYIEATPNTRVIAEGIETPADLEQAVALGARYGQGWLLGRPAPLPDGLGELDHPAFTARAHRRGDERRPDTPTTILDRVPSRIGRKSLLARLTRHLEVMAAAVGEPVTVLATFQHVSNFTPSVAARYSALGATHPHAFVAALAVGMPADPADHVHGTDIAVGDDLASDWVLTVVGPNYFGALIARDIGDPESMTDRRYTYLLTHDRQIVADAARSLMRRVQIDRPHQGERFLWHSER